jgi:hypothetical protein
VYKGASESLQRRHAVDKPHPSKGYIDGPSDARDVLAPYETMTFAQLLGEQAQLRTELGNIEQQLAVAKTLGEKRAVSLIGQRKAPVCSRLSMVGEYIKARRNAMQDVALTAAVKEIVDEETALRIFRRTGELRAEAERKLVAFGAPASGIETEGRAAS